MTFAVPRRLGAAVFALGLLPALAGWPASAEMSGRTWTDPPPREAADAKSGSKPETPKASDAPLRSTAAAATPRPAKVSAARAPARRVAARPAAPRRPVLAAAPRRHAPTIRTVTMRPAAPALPAPRYGYVVEASPDRPGTFVGGRMFEEDRALRIRRAQEAGYIVVRSRSVEFPDGRRLRTYRPLDEEAED